MIGQIRGGTEPDERAGYLALHLDQDGTWIPVDGTIHESTHQAAQQCVRDLEDYVAILVGSFVVQMKSIRASLARMVDTPRPGDKVRVKGRLCHIEEDGSLVVPVVRSKASVSREHLVGHVNDSIYETLRVVLNLSGERAQVSALIVDLVIEELVEVLDKTTVQAPDELAKVSKFAVDLFRLEESLQTTSEWHESPESSKRGAP